MVGNGRATLEARFKGVIPPNAIDFLVYLLEMDPAKRPTATDALRHPYLYDGKKPLESSQKTETSSIPPPPVSARSQKGGRRPPSGSSVESEIKEDEHLDHGVSVGFFL